MRDVRARQALVQGVLEDDDAPPVASVGSRRMEEGAQAVADAIGGDLGFQLGRFREAPNVDAAFAYLRERAESAGVFVLLIGDLGNHRTELDTEAFRGFALAGAVAPVVVINDRDAHSAWAFTLLHELAHLWLGASGVSGARAASAIERFCNDVATRILLPVDEPLALGVWADEAELATAIRRAAAPLRLSRTLIAFRLFRAGVIPEASWESLRTRFRAEWRHDRDSRKATRQGGGGPDFYVVRRQRLGRRSSIWSAARSARER